MDVTRPPSSPLPASDLARLALAITGMALATVAAVWAFQFAGYTPCELCLQEREPFYASLAVGLAAAIVARMGNRRLTRVSFGLLALVFAVSTGLAAYHAGVEWKFWAGPSGCTGAVQAPAAVNDFLKQLDTVKVVRCDAAALRILGLSLAGWNVLVSLALLALSVYGMRRAGPVQRVSREG